MAMAVFAIGLGIGAALTLYDALGRYPRSRLDTPGMTGCSPAMRNQQQHIAGRTCVGGKTHHEPSPWRNKKSDRAPSGGRVSIQT
jgi:hypothetical protein